MTENNRIEPSPRSNAGVFVTIGIALALILAWVLLVRPEVSLKEATHRPGVGQPLPLLELQPLTGTTQGISLEDLRGKVALIDFWGPWCGYCVQEFPHLIELWDRNRENPEFAFISVSCDGQMPDNIPKLRSDTLAFLQKHETAIPTYVDLNGASRTMLQTVMQAPSFGYPTTVLLDRNGVIRAIWLGYEPGYEHQMEQLVSQALSETASK